LAYDLGNHEEGNLTPEEQPRLVLGSASPRRKELLARVGVPFRVEESHIEEGIEPGEKPERFTQRIADRKAQAVAGKQEPHTWVLGADTAVVVDDQVLGKPENRSDGARMLKLLSGRTHRVLTAVVLAPSGPGTALRLLSETLVRFVKLSQTTIQGYLDTGEPLDKAGAYGIQGIGAMLVSSIQGSYTNVVGLPLAETMEMLEEAGIYRPFERAWRQA
jgi:septum formation protein